MSLKAPAMLAVPLAGLLVLAGCGGQNVTSARLENAIAPAFAHLYGRQQTLLGRATRTPPQASAACHRSTRALSSAGAGDDWVCQLLLDTGGPATAFTYEVNAKANGCYTADGPATVIGGRTLIDRHGHAFVNPLFAIDGCFDTT